MEFLSKLNYQPRRRLNSDSSDSKQDAEPGLGDSSNNPISPEQQGTLPKTQNDGHKSICATTAAASSSVSPGIVHEVRVITGNDITAGLPVSVMRFMGELNPTKWLKCKMVRDVKKGGSSSGHGPDSTTNALPLTGAGSEYGAQAREKAMQQMRERKYQRKEMKREDRPWLMKLTTSEDGTRQYKGAKEGGISDHANYYIFASNRIGTEMVYEAYPVSSWFDFKPIPRRVNFTAEEAEEKFQRRNETYNYFSLQTKKRLGVAVDPDDLQDATTKKKRVKSSGENASSSDDEEENRAVEGKKSKQNPYNGILNQSNDDEDLENEARMEYMSSSSEASSESEVEEKADNEEMEETANNLFSSSESDTGDEDEITEAEQVD